MTKNIFIKLINLQVAKTLNNMITIYSFDFLRMLPTMSKMIQREFELCMIEEI